MESSLQISVGAGEGCCFGGDGSWVTLGSFGCFFVALETCALVGLREKEELGFRISSIRSFLTWNSLVISADPCVSRVKRSVFGCC